MARYMVTGGAGFIGSHIARRLLERGDEVFVVDNLSTGDMVNIPPQVVFINLDLSRPSELKGLPEEPLDAVLHLAAQTSGEISHEVPELDLATNGLGTMLLLE